jgi:hypothetical protein
MGNVEPIFGDEAGADEHGDSALVVFAERLLREPELVQWLGGDPPPAPWDDEDGPEAA